MNALSTRTGSRAVQISRANGSYARSHGLVQQRRRVVRQSVPDSRSSQQQDVISVAKLADLFAAQPTGLEEEDRAKLDRITRALGVTLGEAKTLAFKKKALLELEEAELKSRVDQVAALVGVTPEEARRMAAIQPNLLIDPKRNGEALALGLRAICYELNCPKEEAVALILNNRSILHGREMHLSVADIAHLAMLRQPTGRIAAD